MTEIFGIAAIGSSTSLNLVNRPEIAPQANPLRTAALDDFGTLLSRGIEAVDQKLGKADALVKQFAIDDNIPVHQVTIAIEEARLSVELAMQVRMRLVEGYRELMNMQL